MNESLPQSKMNSDEGKQVFQRMLLDLARKGLLKWDSSAQATPEPENSLPAQESQPLDEQAQQQLSEDLDVVEQRLNQDGLSTKDAPHLARMMLRSVGRKDSPRKSLFSSARASQGSQIPPNDSSKNETSM